MNSTDAHANDLFGNTLALHAKFPYPHGAGTTHDQHTQLEEIAGFGTKGKGCLTHLLAMVSDCLYHYELDDDFHDGDMKLAYLAMKKAWESGGDTKPFFRIVARNRKALNWTHIALIWLMVLDRNDDYWVKATTEHPELNEEKKAMVAKFMEHFGNFRKEWKELHEAERISSILVSFEPEGWNIVLYGKKETNGNETDDPTA